MVQECAKRLWLLFIVYCEEKVRYSKAWLVFLLCLSQIHTFCCGCTFARQISQECCIQECWKLADNVVDYDAALASDMLQSLLLFVSFIYMVLNLFLCDNIWVWPPPPPPIIMYKKLSVNAPSCSACILVSKKTNRKCAECLVWLEFIFKILMRFWQRNGHQSQYMQQIHYFSHLSYYFIPVWLIHIIFNNMYPQNNSGLLCV